MGSMDRWIIQPNVLGGWDVKAREAAKPSFQTSTRKEAEDWAQKASAPGETVVVVNRTGQILNRFAVPGAVPVSEPAPAPAARAGKPRRQDHGKKKRTAPVAAVESGPVAAPAQPPMRIPVQPSGPAEPAARGIPEILEEGESLNGWMTDFLLPIVAALSTASGTAYISEEVATAAREGGWFAVFIVTLSWSLGSAMATYFLICYPPKSAGHAGAVAAASMLGAWGIATVVGVGVLEISTAELMNPKTHLFVHVLAVFASTAFTAYGFGGALLSAGIGIWLGLRVAQRLPAT
jgi:hypothetical protein